MVNNKLAITITIFIAVLIGIILLSTTANQIEEIERIRNVTNESFTGINSTYVALANDLMTHITVRNNSADVLTVATHYVVDLDRGWVNITAAGANRNDTNGENTYFADYEYQPNAYANNSTAKSLIGLIILFFAIGIIGITMLWFAGMFDDLKGIF